jgi:phosphoribosyl 1,2-cyclic phosphate phosphodiesterase
VKVTFLGSGAAEGYPALWCRCERCATARQRGGRNLRFRSSALINDDLLIDPGPDTVAATVRLGLDLAPVQAALVTHPHSDHLEATTFYWRRKGFVATALPPLDLYASAASIARVLRHEGRDIAPESLYLRPHLTTAYQQLDITTSGETPPDTRFPEGSQQPPVTPARRYEVHTLAASHAEPAMEPMFFGIRQVAGPEAEGRATPPSLLYATDTGPFSDETWSSLRRLGEQGWRFSATAIDSTSGLGPDSKAHMNIRQMAWHQDELARLGLLADDAQRHAHHFSHNGTPPYEELEAHLAPQNIHPTWDGLTLTV